MLNIFKISFSCITLGSKTKSCECYISRVRAFATMFYGLQKIKRVRLSGVPKWQNIYMAFRANLSFL